MVGMAVGMGSSWDIIKGILIGIIPHKVIVLSSLGAQYIHSKLKFKIAIVFAVVFASMMPFGVLAGHIFIHSLGIGWFLSLSLKIKMLKIETNFGDEVLKTNFLFL